MSSASVDLGSNISSGGGGGGGVTTMAAVGSSPNANAATIASTTLTMQPASGSFPGVVTILAQSFAGIKTFTDTTQSTTKDTGAIIAEGGLGVEKNITAGGTIAASNFSGSSSGTNTGDITLAAVGSSANANGATLTAQALNLEPASASFPGVVTTGAQTLAGAKTFSTAPILSSLTASTALVLDGSKNIASLAYAQTATASTIAQRDGSGNLIATNLPATANVSSLGITISGAGSTITTGTKGFLYVPYACTINSVTLLADASGSIVIDIKKAAYASFPPSSSIVASAPPTLSGAQSSQDVTLTGWTVAVAAGDVLAFSVTSATTVQQVSLALKVTR